MKKKRAPLPPEGTWTYEEQQLWVLVGQSWAQNPEERYEIRKIKNFLKDLVCDKTPGGPQGGSSVPSPESDSGSEAAQDLDRARIWLYGELYGHLTSLVEGSQDWDSSCSYSQKRISFLSSSRLIFTFADYFGDIDSDGLSTTEPIYAALLRRTPLPDDSVPHSESIQERLRRLDVMDLSESRILLLEKIHQEMWTKLPTIGFIKWDDLPWPVFVRPTCREDLMLHRIVSYLLQVSSGMDVKEALMDSSHLQWAQQRLWILLGHWGQPRLQKKVKNLANKTIIQGVNVVVDHLESVLHFLNTQQIDEAHHTDLTAIVSQTFLKHTGQNLALILTDPSDNSGYKSLLRLKGDSAQKMLNFLQTVCYATAQNHYESYYLQAA